MKSILPFRALATPRAFAVSVSALVILTLGACATKEFEELPAVDPAKLRAMSCEEIDVAFLELQRHERGVDQEATSGQAEQILWGGLWSVMADEKLEAIARQKIRDRERHLYEAKLRKKCS